MIVEDWNNLKGPRTYGWRCNKCGAEKALFHAEMATHHPFRTCWILYPDGKCKGTYERIEND